MKGHLSKIRTLLCALLLLFPFAMQAQATATDRIVQIILDAEAVFNAGSRIPELADEMINLEAYLGQLGPIIGYQRHSLPVELQPISNETAPKVKANCDQLIAITENCRKILKTTEKQRSPEMFADAWTIFSPHPGCYYMGMNWDPLCKHSLRMEMNSIQIQDYPFSEAAASDPCLMEMAKHAPNLTELVAFGCDIDDATLAAMHLEQLKKLTVLDLAENSISEVPQNLLEAGSIRSLSLAKNEISQMPADLKPFSGLLYLELNGNKISESEQARIKKGLPGTKVVF
ncbi:MAG: hypothetical protein RLZZ519_3489 [Bacteroidota bacterium]